MNLKLSIKTAEPLCLQVERFLRHQIEAGELKPAQRLPSTNELVAKWGVDRVTIQRAMARLKTDGLIERWPRRGTFVRDVTRGIIGLLTSQDLTNEAVHSYRAMVRALEKAVGHVPWAQNKKGADGATSSTFPAQSLYPRCGRPKNFAGKVGRLSVNQQWTTRVYDKLAGLVERGDPGKHPACQRLLGDFRNHPFKGWVEIGTPRYLFKRFDFGEAGCLPSVRWGPLDENSDVVVDMADFGRQSAAFFARKGCRKIVYLRTSHDRTGQKPDLNGWLTANETGLAAPIVVQLLSSQKSGTELERTAFETTLTLAGEWDRKNAWPDGLLVSDDIAMRGVVLALSRYWPVLATRPLLVTLANEGVELHYGLPVTRWEQPITTAARLLLERLRMRMAGKPLSPEPVMVKGKLKEQRQT